VLTSALEENPVGRREKEKGSATPEPNFFIVGAAKAGTTSLYHYLRQHPDVFMPDDKEPWHFCNLREPAPYSATQYVDVNAYRPLRPTVARQLRVLGAPGIRTAAYSVQRATR